MPETNDVAATARLRARIELAEAEIRTLCTVPLQPRMRTILATSATDIKCARAGLESGPDNLELENLGRWVEMIENQLHAVRRALIPIEQSLGTQSRTA
jgi:hypothetical protein